MKVFFTTLLFHAFIFCAYAQPGLLPCDFNLGPDVQVCNNAVFNLNPHPIQGGTYAWTGDAGLSCSSCPTPTVSGLTTGIYTFIATVTTSDCTASDTIRVTVVNGEAPQYEIIENTGMCMGDSIDLGGPEKPGTFYNWFSVPAGFVSMLADPKAKPIAQTTYYLLASNTSCPFPSLDSVKITPVTLNLSLLPGDTVRLCQGQSRTLQALVSPAGQPVTWSQAPGLQPSPNGATAIANPVASTLYTATAMLGGCKRERQIFVAVDSLPKNLAILPADTTVCQGQVVKLRSFSDLTGFPGISYEWSPNTGVIGPTNTINLEVMPQQPTPYRRITRNGVCVDTAQAIVRVVPKPQILAAPEQSAICRGDSVSLNVQVSAGVGNITWAPATGLSCANCLNPVATPAATTQYIVSGSVQNCATSDTVNIAVQDLAPLKFPTDVLLCPGDSVRLNDSSDLFSTYRWTSTHPGFDTLFQAKPVFKPTQTATYFVLADNGCLRYDSIRIFVSAATLSVDGDTTICKNFSAPLSASSNLTGTFQWRNDLTGQIISTMQVTAVSPAVTTPYTLIFTYGDNCQLSKPVLVQVDGEAPTIVFPADPRLCPGESTPLNTGPVLTGAQYHWSAVPADPLLADTLPNPIVQPGQDTRYTVTAALGNCSVTRSIDVVAYAANLTLTGPETICAGASALLVANGSNPNGSYFWSNGATTASINPAPTAPTTYTVTFAFGDTCSLKKSVLVNVVDNFKLNLQSFPDTNQVFVGTPVTLIALTDPPQNLSNFNLGWEEKTVDTKLLPFTTESVEVVPSSNDTTVAEVTYKVTLTTANGCQKTASKTFKLIFPKVDFPNAFTPDNDGENDVFRMVILNGLAVVDRMEIFNRWGQKIYESTDPAASWDGTVNGEPVPSDVYVYRVWWRRGDGALQVQSQGNITLLR